MFNGYNLPVVSILYCIQAISKEEHKLETTCLVKKRDNLNRKITKR